MNFEIAVITISIILSAFFSGMEIAFVSANKLHIELEKKQSGLFPFILNKLTRKPSKFITTMLVGNNISLVVYTYFMGELLINWFQMFLPSKFSALNYLLTEASLF